MFTGKLQLPFKGNYYQAVILDHAFNDIAEHYNIPHGIRLFGTKPVYDSTNRRKGPQPPAQLTSYKLE